jgi:hypothetical protein
MPTPHRQTAASVVDRIAILNHPGAPHAVEWSVEALRSLKAMGFTAVQVNIGWGPRPADEPLNLEDVLSVEEAEATLDLFSDPGRLDERRTQLAARIEMCRSVGLRTAFNFGAPFNQHATHGGTPPRLSDRLPLAVHLRPGRMAVLRIRRL